MKKKKLSQLQLLLKKAWNRQRFSVLVTLLLIFAAALFMFTSVTLFASGGHTVEKKMDRLGFGDFTMWVADHTEGLGDEIRQIEDVKEVTEQKLIYAGYEVNGQYSDNEGQLLFYDGAVPYDFIDRNGKILETPDIKRGTIYISPAMESMFGVRIGDTITFELSRSDTDAGSRKKVFVVAGYFEDAFMGSSMIDMKSFLVQAEDYEEMRQIIEAAGTENALGQRGAMLHVTQKENPLAEEAFYKLMQENTDVLRYIKFTYKKASIAGYMLLLQNIVSGFLMVFAGILFIVCLIMTRHSLTLIIEQEKKDMAILKTMGLSGRLLSAIYMILYGGSGGLGLVMGLLLCKPAAELIARGMLTSTGIPVDIRIPVMVAALIFAAAGFLLTGFIYFRTKKIRDVSPMETIRGTGRLHISHSSIHRPHLTWYIALRNVLADKRKYVSFLCIAMLLVLFLSIIGQMGTWLGAKGEGLMNAFSVADHDIGVQPFSASVPMDEIERAINWYSPIKDKYELAMESVAVNGQEYTANVLNDTRWFHMLKGQVCDGNSILITDTVAEELNVGIGDRVLVSAKGMVKEYEISGIYQCANGMGANIGMSIEGYSQIGDITGFIWCFHYILKDGGKRDYVYTYLQEHYTGIDVHTNSWSGLDGIVFVMHLSIIIFYVVAAGIILLSVALISEKFLQSEKSDMAIYKSLGLGTRKLRISFVLRLLLPAAAGAFAGLAMGEIFGGSLIGMVFKQVGIGAFEPGFGILGNAVPMVIVLVLFMTFAWAFSARLGQISIKELIAESEE